MAAHDGSRASRNGDSSRPPGRAASASTRSWLPPAILVGHDLGALTAGAALLAHWSTLSLAYVAVVVGLLASFGFYRLPLGSTVHTQAPRLLAVTGLPLLVVGPFAGRGLALALVWQAGISPLLVLAGRWSAWSVIRRLRRVGRLSEPALVLGGGRVAEQLVEALGRRPEYGVVPLGYVDDQERTTRIPRLGGFAELPAILARSGVRTVVVAFSSTREHELVGLLRSALLDGKDVYVVPRLFDIGPSTWAPGEEVWGVPLYRVRPVGPRMPSWRWKRALDVIGAAVLLVVFMPTLAAISLAVRLTSPGPVLFHQTRVGRDGREFEMLKFRTLHLHATSHTAWSTAAADNMTPVGRFLRRLHLDELPQLWNVLRGEMSLVGPRPERVHFVRQFEGEVPGYEARHRVPGGLTGWAQVHGLRGDARIEERARFDNRYIEHWSLWRDFTILLRTVVAVARGNPDAGPDSVELQASRQTAERDPGRHRHDGI